MFALLLCFRGTRDPFNIQFVWEFELNFLREGFLCVLYGTVIDRFRRTGIVFSFGTLIVRP